MSFIKTIPLEEATGEVLELYQRQQGPYGYVPNYAKVFCYRPQVMLAWANLQKTIRKTIDVRTYELVTLAAATTIHSSYCSLAHGKILHDSFYTKAELHTILHKEGAGVLTPKQQQIFKYAKKVAGDTSTITAQDIEDLKAVGCDDEEIFDIATAAAARCFFARIPDALGVQPDSTFSAMEAEMQALLTVGRSISEEDPQSI